MAKKDNGLPLVNDTSDPSKSKAENFARLADSRVNRALDAIASIAKLANKATYDYTDEQAAKIVTALTDRVDSVKDAFEGKSGGFRL